MTSLSVKAMIFAHGKHLGQKYGNQPYIAHLASVVGVLLDFGYGGDEELLAAAWLHDVIEDQDVSRPALELAFGSRVAELVWSVSGVGFNRKDRNASIYRKLEAHPEACVLKIADRIANVEQAGDGTRHKVMYLHENAAFLAVVSPHVPQAMVDRLNKSFGLDNPADAGPKARYYRHINNAGIHCNRFPAWEELTEAQRETWRQPEDDR